MIITTPVCQILTCMSATMLKVLHLFIEVSPLCGVVPAVIAVS